MKKKYRVRVERFRSSMDIARVDIEANDEEHALEVAQDYAKEHEEEIEWLLNWVEDTDAITTEHTQHVYELEP